VAKLAAAFGRPLMPWQQHVADVALEVDGSGLFAYKSVRLTVPRQSGKTILDGGVMSHRALIIPRGRVWFTFQTRLDAADWLINEFWPLLGPFGAAVTLRRQAGSENLRWRASAGLVRPFPPNEGGLHSKVSDMVVVDECWKFDLVQGQAIDAGIVPTQATRPNAQTWKVSTAGTAKSTWWLGAVEQGRAAAAAEWSCPDHLDPCAESSWPVYHPAFGRTIGPEAMRAALDELGPDEFARAYGNRWTSTVARVIPLAAWRAAAEEPAPLPERLALAFDVAVDRSDAAIVAAWRDEAGVAHVEVDSHQAGVGWLPARVAELVGRWGPVAVGYDEAGPALDVADTLRRAGAELVGLKAREYAAACAGLLEALVSDPPQVRYRPHPALDAAANDAARRALGDAWAWGRRQSAGSLSALTAATVAVWAFDHAPADIGRFRVF
jgi:hypothetical protein